jgi:hypothetical protein
MARKPFVIAGGEQLSKSVFRKLSRARKIKVMRAWFHENYEDPVHRLPHNSREGGYQWVNGGPVAALEGLQDLFSEEVADFDLIEAAVREIEGEDGTFDWSPKPDDDFDPLDEEAAFLVTENGEFIVTDNGEGIIVGRGDVTPRNDQTAALRATMLQRFDELEALIRAGQRDRGMIGHNNPPGPIDDLPITRGDLDEIQRAIDEVRGQAQAPQPATETVRASSGTLRRMAGVIGGWLADRANAVVDAGIQGLILGAVGAAVIQYAEQLVTLLNTAAAVAMDWIHALQLPF